jgi:hypothetical protein
LAPARALLLAVLAPAVAAVAAVAAAAVVVAAAAVVVGRAVASAGAPGGSPWPRQSREAASAASWVTWRR